MMKTLLLAAATILALDAAPVFSDAAHFQPGAQPTSAAGAYLLASVLEPGTRGDVVTT